MSDKPNTTAAACCVPIAPPEPRQGVRSAAQTLAALADPTRLQIVSMLAVQEAPLCVCDITSAFELGQPTISHHLKVLRDARLVRWEKRGLWVYYSVDPGTLGEVSGFLVGLAKEAKSAEPVRA
jgi:ArsR family transcriptional regulator, arsenate/arsenite/antimonite-responsive transcriptional repressor